MKSKLLLLFIMTPLLLINLSCNQKELESKIADLEANIIDLETQLDDCQNGSEKLLARMNNSFESKNYEEVKLVYDRMLNRHPESNEFKEAKIIFDNVIEIETKKRKEKEEKAKKEKADREKSLKKLKKNLDDISGITWYKQPYFTHYNNRFLTSIYMGQKYSDPWLRIKMSYKGDSWIFFDKAYLSYDGYTKEIIFEKYEDKETDHGSGSVWEWIDVSVSPSLQSYLREFAKSKNAKMRFTGKYTKTRTLTYNERRGILDVLDAYDALKSNS